MEIWMEIWHFAAETQFWACSPKGLGVCRLKTGCISVNIGSCGDFFHKTMLHNLANDDLQRAAAVNGLPTACRSLHTDDCYFFSSSSTSTYSASMTLSS